MILQRTVYGRCVALAIGQNMRAAHLAGVKVERTRCITYVMSAAFAGLVRRAAGRLLRRQRAEHGRGIPAGDSIAVVVIGGTSVAGGRANVPGIWGARLVPVSAGHHAQHLRRQRRVRLVLTGLIIIAMITLAGGDKPSPLKGRITHACE